MAHMALHESQRQQGAPPPLAEHSPPAETNSSTQQEAPAEQLPTEQQQQQGLDPQATQAESLQPPKDVTVPHRLQEALGAKAAQGAQQQGQVQEQQARSGISAPTGSSFLDSMTKQDPQQQLLQQLAAQAGFQLVSPAGQSAGPAQGVMHQAEQGTPMQAALPHQQQQEWAALSHAGVDPDLDPEFSQGLLHQLGRGLQSSAMQYASMQQQQQVQHQSRLPAWAQQALLPDQTPPVTPPTAYYGMPGLSPAHSMQALPSPPAHSLPGQYVNGGHLLEHYEPAGVRASLGAGGWHLPTWPRQQQAQPAPHCLLDPHAQQYGNVAAPGSLHDGGQGPYHTPHTSSLLDLRSSQAAAFWPSSHGGADVGTPADHSGRQSPPMMQSQAGDADALHLQGSALRQQHGSRGEGCLPHMMQDSRSGTAAPAKLSLQDPSQAETGLPSVLSGGSSGVSSPLRGSGHLESLVEINNRVEAATGRARAQLQVNLMHCV